MESTSLPLLLTIEQTAALIGFAPKAISKWLYGYRPAPVGWPRPVKAGRSVRFRRIDVESWVNGLGCHTAKLMTDAADPSPPRRCGRPKKWKIGESLTNSSSTPGRFTQVCDWAVRAIGKDAGIVLTEIDFLDRAKDLPGCLIASRARTALVYR